MCLSDVSTAIFTMSSPDMFVNHVTFLFSQFITYRSLGSVSLDRSPSLLHDKYVSSVKLTTVWIFCPLLWCLTLPRSHQRKPYLMNHNGGWYFVMILFQTIMVFGEWVNLLQFKDTARWLRHTIYHCITCMIYRTRVCMLAVQSFCAWVCIWQTKFRACSHLHQLPTIGKVS